MESWLHPVTLLWVIYLPEFLWEILHTGHILNSLPAFYVSWLVLS